MREFNSSNNRRDSDEKYKDSSKKRLLNNIKSKFNTTTIGSLAIFEEAFGFLWGHGIHPDELSEEEKEWRETWADARTKILDLGNSNSRGAQSEISQYTLSWNRYVTKFKIYDKRRDYDE
tara:strand:- start:3303 stop:3662 length:360 start_codon:yes stop_codon:yes gene_type:complete